MICRLWKIKDVLFLFHIFFLRFFVLAAAVELNATAIHIWILGVV